jgi:protein-serine/threonine kinase
VPITREGSGQSRNSLVIVQADKLLPPHPAERSGSNASITQFDTFRNDERTAIANARPQQTASSSAAQKVMNWFRRKSYVKSSFVPPPPISREASGLSKQASPRGPGAPTAPSPLPRPTESTPSSRDNKENTSPRLSPRPEDEPNVASESSRAQVTETVIHAPQPRRSVVADPPSIGKLPRPATVGRDLVKHSETRPTPQVVSSVTSSPFNEARLRVHVGVVDQSALTSKGALEVMEQVLKVLHGMGIEVKRESEFKLRCSRARRKKAGAMTGLGLSTFANGSMASMATLANASSSNVSSVLG